jgi:TonB family protein
MKLKLLQTSFVTLILFSCSCTIYLIPIASGQIMTRSQQEQTTLPCDTNICKEIFPKYPGGDENLISIIEDSIQYPENALRNKIGGRVFINFYIDSTGVIRNPKILRGINPELDREALRVITVIPPFIPAEQCCRKVNVSYNMPIHFDPNKKRKTKK